MYRDPTDPTSQLRDKTFWLVMALSLWGSSFLAGAAVALRAIDDDALMGIGLALSALLAMGQLLGFGGILAALVRCGAIFGLFLLGAGWGMQTGFLLAGQTGRGIGYLGVVGGASLFAVIGGSIGATLRFIISKMTRETSSPQRGLLADTMYRQKAMWSGFAAPVVLTFYLLVRYVLHSISVQSLSSQNDMVVWLVTLDAVLAISVLAAMTYLLISALRARRRLRAAIQPVSQSDRPRP
ncbi:MAG: hypothetical protein FJ276_09465 [Planctomycetes bacterium]|nr:hypothetical protein [Planctomycetota bacterium]